jgi:hypothetical protein
LELRHPEVISPLREKKFSRKLRKFSDSEPEIVEPEIPVLVTLYEIGTVEIEMVTMEIVIGIFIHVIGEDITG